MNRPGIDVLVVGAGVSGLTTAVCLAEAGRPVRVYTDQTRDETTSYAAGAVWGSYLASHEDAGRWNNETFTIFEKLSKVGGCGVRMVEGTEASREVVEPPARALQVKGLRRAGLGDLPAGFLSGWSYTVPVIDMPLYLRYLERRLEAADGKVEKRKVTSLSALHTEAAVVVNCSGIRARTLVPDEELTAVRGQLVVVDNPGIETFFAEHTESTSDLTYILPQGDHLVLGGSAHPGRLDLAPDRDIAAAILCRCAEIEPRLNDVTVREVRVGLRPTRARIRVEHLRDGGRHLVHNYGHGGAGVSLSWGCAGDIRGMLEAV